MHRFWAPDGFDAAGLFFFLGTEHPLAVLAAVAALTWLGFALADWVREPEGAGLRTDGAGLDEEAPDARGSALAKIREADPAFDEAAFLKRVEAAFRAVQEAWSAQDLARARAFVSDGVHERFSRLIAEHRARGVRNRVRDVALGETEVLGYASGAHFDAAYVAFKGSAVDEFVTLDGASPVSGGRGDIAEVWTFLRRPGAKTLARPGLLEGLCPNCGAPLDIADAARCAACKTWVNSGEHDWVLTAVTQAAQWEFPNPGREVDYWAEMRAADPGLSLEALADRAAVAFWRWYDARRRGDPSPLGGVASADFVSGLSFDGTFERAASVELAETEAFEPGEAGDRAHVLVRWDGDAMKRLPSGLAEYDDRRNYAHFLTFYRRAGVRSDPRHGLTSARCPGCGASPEQPDAPACAYCGAVFNDGSRGWVLAAVTPFGEWRRPDAH